MQTSFALVTFGLILASLLTPHLLSIPGTPSLWMALCVCGLGMFLHARNGF